MFNFIFKTVATAVVFAIGYKVGKDGIGKTITAVEDLVNDASDRVSAAWDELLAADEASRAQSEATLDEYTKDTEDTNLKEL